MSAPLSAAHRGRLDVRIDETPRGGGGVGGFGAALSTATDVLWRELVETGEIVVDGQNDGRVAVACHQAVVPCARRRQSVLRVSGSFCRAPRVCLTRG
jgi:hypothetical protein